MDIRDSHSQSLQDRVRRKRREILFAVVLTFAAAAYLLSSHGVPSKEVPVSLNGKTKIIE